jgi:hypothetical protein
MSDQVKLPRGIRNNNPGNIRHSPAKWQGMSLEQPDKAFVKFDEPFSGIRALAKLLLNYQRKHGLSTPREIINRWAPPKENNTNAYVNAVAHAQGVHPDTRLNLKDPITLKILVQSIILHENGPGEWYSSELVTAAVDAALE